MLQLSLDRNPRNKNLLSREKGSRYLALALMDLTGKGLPSALGTGGLASASLLRHHPSWHSLFSIRSTHGYGHKYASPGPWMIIPSGEGSGNNMVLYRYY